MERNSRVKPEIAGMMLFTTIGLAVEIFATGSAKMNPQGSGIGHVSILMAILYCGVYLASPWIFMTLDNLKLKNRFLRALALVFLIYALEWSFGALCRSAGFRPWDYSWVKPAWTTSFSDGNITLVALPGWYVYALLVEPIIKSLREMMKFLDERNILTWNGFWALTANGGNR